MKVVYHSAWWVTNISNYLPLTTGGQNPLSEKSESSRLLRKSFFFIVWGPWNIFVTLQTLFGLMNHIFRGVNLITLFDLSCSFRDSDYLQGSCEIVVNHFHEKYQKWKASYLRSVFFFTFSFTVTFSCELLFLLHWDRIIKTILLEFSS